MAGIFPNTGVGAPNTANAQNNPDMKAGCEPLYFPQNCNPRFNPLVMNAVISELVNAINTGQDYDCSKINNLATVLNGIRNLCGQKTYENGPDANDFIAGCFDNVSGKVSVQSLVDLIASMIGVCALPTATNPDLNDTIAMCVDGVASQVSVTDFQTLFPDAETDICGLPTVNTVANDDFVGVCRDGDSSKISVANLKAVFASQFSIFRDASTVLQPGNVGTGWTISLADMTFPKAMRLGVSVNGSDPDSAGLTIVVPQGSGGITDSGDDGMNFANTKSGGNQYYTYIPSRGIIYRLIGSHLTRSIVSALNVDQDIFVRTSFTSTAGNISSCYSVTLTPTSIL